MSESVFRQKTIEELTFIDDGMFQAVLHNPEICAELVEKLLHIKVKKVEYPELEKVIAPFYTTKGVRLDVYLKDEDKIIDVELQSYPQDALGKRTRYYQSMIDMDSLMKGQDYSELKDSYILFICTFDPFKDADGKKPGLPCYTFKSICSENPLLNLNDNCTKVIYNSTAYNEEKDEGIKNLLKFICTNQPGQDDFSNRLSSMVEKLKDNEKFRSDYAAMNLHDRDITRAAKREGIAEGIIQGTQQKAVEAAINLIKMNILTPEQIAKAESLPIEKVLELQKELSGKIQL